MSANEDQSSASQYKHGSPMHTQGERSLYLDYNATTPVRAEVFTAMRPWLESQWGNASSAHAYGRAAKAAIDKARAQVAALIGAQAHEIIFTSGGTESDNLAVFGLGVETRASLLSSAMEHPAIEAALAERQLKGATWHRLRTKADGRVDVADPKLDAPADLLTVILAHNETGVVQPVTELVQRARAANPAVVVHSDAAQAVGKIPVDVNVLDVDALTLVGHKLYAPKGVGALYLREGTQLRPRAFGGGQECGLRPGTEAVHQLVALGEACELAGQELESFSQHMQNLRERLWRGLSAACPGLHRTVDPDTGPCLPNTLHVCVPGKNGREILAAAPGIAASTGSACHAAEDLVPGVLGEMGLPAELAHGALRLSLGRGCDEASVDAAVGVLGTALA